MDDIPNTKEGIFKEYYENGQLLAEGFYKNGVEEGVHKWYSANGKLEFEETYGQAK